MAPRPSDEEVDEEVDSILAREHPIGTKLSALRDVAETMTEDPIARIHYAGKGMLAVIDAVADEVWKLETMYNEHLEADSWRERHSGHGRGDSMG